RANALVEYNRTISFFNRAQRIASGVSASSWAGLCKLFLEKDVTVQSQETIEGEISTARSPELHNAATLDMLCRIALDAHYASGLPAVGSLFAAEDS
ncbi:hypothetical protein MPER_04595, partial [Moniliophthora perniciosa FA553]